MGQGHNREEWAYACSTIMHNNQECNYHTNQGLPVITEEAERPYFKGVLLSHQLEAEKMEIHFPCKLVVFTVLIGLCY